MQQLVELKTAKHHDHSKLIRWPTGFFSSSHFRLSPTMLTDVSRFGLSNADVDLLMLCDL
jgi:hypothetical protein